MWRCFTGEMGEFQENRTFANLSTVIHNAECAQAICFGRCTGSYIHWSWLNQECSRKLVLGIKNFLSKEKHKVYHTLDWPLIKFLSG